jgi:DNA polymerase-1
MSSKPHLLIDGDLIVYRFSAAQAKEIQWADGLVTVHADTALARSDIQSEVCRLLKKFRTDRFTFCLSDAVNFRKGLHPSYKSARGAKPVGFNPIKEWAHEHFNAVVYPSLEADDTLGLLSADMDNAIIVSWDKDMCQIPGRHYDPRQNKTFSVTPEQGWEWFLTQVLTGDRVDGYTGLPGCGPKTAEKILDGNCTWAAVVEAYEQEGLTEKDALVQARLAYILKNPSDYSIETGRITLWTPPKITSTSTPSTSTPTSPKKRKT